MKSSGKIVNIHSKASYAVLLVFLPAGCGKAGPVTATVASSAATTAAPPALTATPGGPAPTQTPFPPTATAVPPTVVPSATPTHIPPTETPAPTHEPTLAQPSVDDVLSSLDGLPIDEFLTESWRQLQVRDADILFTNGLADVYGVVPGEQFTDLSADYVQETHRLERRIPELLRTCERSALSSGQRISYDCLEWYLAMQVRGQAFADYRFLVNPVRGLQNWPIDFLMEYPLEDNGACRLSCQGDGASQAQTATEGSPARAGGQGRDTT